MARVCARGHSVNEDYLRACPKCGAQLPAVLATEERDPSSERESAADSDGVPATSPVEPAASLVNRAPRGLPMLVGGIVLGLFGSLLSYAADRGPAEFFGRVLLGLGGVLLLIGAIALGVKLGVEDARKD